MYLYIFILIIIYIYVRKLQKKKIITYQINRRTCTGFNNVDHDQNCPKIFHDGYNSVSKMKYISDNAVE